MKVRKIKKYIFYLTALMPFIMVLLNVIYMSFTNQVIDENIGVFSDYILVNFSGICESFVPKFFNSFTILDSVFGITDTWGDCLFSYFGYFVAICLYNILIEVLLFFVYLFESWVNKIEKDF